MLYGVSYGIACVAMRWSSLAVLLVSRVLSGVAYSLLFSSFESWAITEVDRMRIDRRYLVQLFSAATFFNAASAVAAGIAGNAVVANPDGRTAYATGGNRYAPAFDVGAVSLFTCALGAKTWWAEADPARAPAEAEAEKSEFPTEEERKGLFEKGVLRAARMVLAEPALLSLGSMNSLYEAALHVFVFVWTPALERRCGRSALAGSGAGAGGPDPEVPHGLVFSLFMACKMAGSQLFALIGDRVPYDRTLRLVFTGSAAAFAVPLLASPDGYGAALCSFCAFEFGLGLYWPAMAVARAELVPNHLRATMTSVFRVPLNVLVMACLAFAGNADEPRFLMMCFSLMTLCLLFAGRKPRAAAEKTVSQSAVAAGA
jgi:MFS family permease